MGVSKPSVGGEDAGIFTHEGSDVRAELRSACPHHHDRVLHCASLRWNYPGQVLRVGGALRPPSQPGCPELPYAFPIVAPESFVQDLAAARIGRTFNQYAQGPRAALLRERLLRYLESRAEAQLLLVGEAPGYRGARVSGIPFTSERQLTGSGPAEATASIVRRVLVRLGVGDDVLLWNVVPTHPGRATGNRAPTAAEIRGGVRFLELLCAGRRPIAVGRTAERVLGAPAVRHPSHGGARDFEAGLIELLDHEPLPGPA
jgi:hypothetical protein